MKNNNKAIRKTQLNYEACPFLQKKISSHKCTSIGRSYLKNHNIKAKRFIYDFCSEDIPKIRETQEKKIHNYHNGNYQNLHASKGKSSLYSHIDFYEHNFVHLNILNRNISVKYIKKPFIPIQSLKCFLTLGITTKNIGFYSIITQKMTVYNYIRHIRTNFEKRKDKLPKVVVVHLPIGLFKREWQRVGKISMIMVPTIQDQIRNIAKFDFIRHQSQKLWNLV